MCSEDSKWPIAESNYEVPQTAALLRPYFAALAVAASQDDAGELWRVGGGVGG